MTAEFVVESEHSADSSTTDDANDAAAFDGSDVAQNVETPHSVSLCASKRPNKKNICSGEV